ncbi:molybdopterin molybdotransferase MoeA [Anaerofustis butyriciformans]|uniref:molybdopterin molybdotransferase MoeA n=1 Tax=Anaerofustis butyriciformans TaxID=3108533 RepID=UPI002E330371|nr:molybdopterin molybdotransferase MoeA [Anaerofustis sp. HA2171]
MLNSYTKNEVLKMLKDDCENIKIKSHVIMIEDCLNHVLAKDVISKVNIPESDIAQIDGYAINHEGLYGVDYYEPIRFDIVNENEINLTQIKKVSKGDKLPLGADSVIDIKYVKEYGSYVTINRPINKNSGVCLKGSTVKENDVVLRKNTLLNSFHIGLLASLNEFMVEVYKKVKVGIISTGNNIIKVRDKDINKDIDICSYILLSELEKKRCVGISYGIYKNADKEVLDKATKECDIVIILNYDKNKFFLESGKCYFEDILISPSKNALIYNINSTFVYVFDSMPKDVLIGFRELVNPVMNYMLDIKDSEGYIDAISLYNIPARKGINEYVFVKIMEEKDETYFEAIDFDASYSEVMRDANGYIEISKNKDKIEKDETVKVTLL